MGFIVSGKCLRHHLLQLREHSSIPRSPHIDKHHRQLRREIRLERDLDNPLGKFRRIAALGTPLPSPSCMPIMPAREVTSGFE